MRRIAQMCAAAVALSMAPIHAAVAEDLVTLTTGETLRGEVTGKLDGALQFSHPVLGALTIPADKVAQVKLGGEQAGEQVEAAQVEADQAAAEAEAAPEAEAKPDESTWKHRAEAGLSGGEGNDEFLNLYLRYVGKSETETDRWKADAAYFLNTDNGERSAHEFNAGLLKDWLFPETPWFLFAQGGVDYDEFADYDFRVTANGGVGYQLVENATLDVRLRAGAGIAREFGSDDESIRPEALLGGEVDWKITDNQTLTANTFIYPDLSDIGEYRITSEAAWEIRLNHADGMSVKVGLQNEYESEVDPGTKHNDLKYFGALIVDF